MKNTYELIVAEYPLSDELDDCLNDCVIYIELFSTKATCAYDIHTNEVRLIRKLQRKLDQLVKKELSQFDADRKKNGTRPLVALDHCLQVLTSILQQSSTLGSTVVLGSIGIEGVIESQVNWAAYDEYAQLSFKHMIQQFKKEE